MSIGQHQPWDWILLDSFAVSFVPSEFIKCSITTALESTICILTILTALPFHLRALVYISAGLIVSLVQFIPGIALAFVGQGKVDALVLAQSFRGSRTFIHG
jgi:hypothetical protein